MITHTLESIAATGLVDTGHRISAKIPGMYQIGALARSLNGMPGACKHSALRPVSGLYSGAPWLPRTVNMPFLPNPWRYL